MMFTESGESGGGDTLDVIVILNPNLATARVDKTDGLPVAPVASAQSLGVRVPERHREMAWQTPLPLSPGAFSR
jgi:hypothetical protein